VNHARLVVVGFSSLCRQPVLDSMGNPMEFSFDSDSATLTLTGTTRLNLAIVRQHIFLPFYFIVSSA